MARSLPPRSKSGRFRKAKHGRRGSHSGKAMHGPMIKGGRFYSKKKHKSHKSAASHTSHKRRSKGATFSAKRLSIKYGGKGLLRVHANPANVQQYAMDKAFTFGGAIAAITVMDLAKHGLSNVAYFKDPKNSKLLVLASAAAPVVAGVATCMLVKQPMVNKLADKWVDAAIVLATDATVGDSIRSGLASAFNKPAPAPAAESKAAAPAAAPAPSAGRVGNLFLPGTTASVLRPADSSGLFMKKSAQGTFVVRGRI